MEHTAQLFMPHFMDMGKLISRALLCAAAGILPLTLTVSCSSISSDTSYADETLPGFKNLLDSVVKIDVWEKTQSDGGSRIVRSVGSGAIISKDGLIITNAHVVNIYAQRIVVTLPSLERVGAKFIGWDHWTDLALIQIDLDEVKRRGLKFSYAQFGNSDALYPGCTVYAVGTPHGFARTVTKGIVSNTNRFFEGTLLDSGYETGSFNTWIQTDAAINPGNSGGPLVLPDGEIVGINTRAYLGAGNLGFSIPSNVAKRVAEEIKNSGGVERSYVGITPDSMQDMESYFDIDANRGVLIRNVDTASPAAVAGILPGDILLKINSKEIDGRFPEQIPEIMNSISSIPVGDTVKITILRSGKEKEFELKTEPLESRVGKEYALEKWGAGIRQITRVFARDAKIDTDSKLLVIGVREGFPFDLAGIERGDIILSVGRKKVRTMDDLEKVYGQLSDAKKDVLIEVMRSHGISFHVLKARSE